jgi:hypothetical protein
MGPEKMQNILLRFSSISASLEGLQVVITFNLVRVVLIRVTAHRALPRIGGGDFRLTSAEISQQRAFGCAAGALNYQIPFAGFAIR